MPIDVRALLEESHHLRRDQRFHGHVPLPFSARVARTRAALQTLSVPCASLADRTGRRAPGAKSLSIGYDATPRPTIFFPHKAPPSRAVQPPVLPSNSTSAAPRRPPSLLPVCFHEGHGTDRMARFAASTTRWQRGDLPLGPARRLLGGSPCNKSASAETLLLKASVGGSPARQSEQWRSEPRRRSPKRCTRRARPGLGRVPGTFRRDHPWTASSHSRSGRRIHSCASRWASCCSGSASASSSIQAASWACSARRCRSWHSRVFFRLLAWRGRGRAGAGAVRERRHEVRRPGAHRPVPGTLLIFLIAPKVVYAESGFPLLALPGEFLLKDLVLMAGAVMLASTASARETARQATLQFRTEMP